MPKLQKKRNNFFVAIDQRSGLYLQEHRMYGSYPLHLRVILTKDLHQAKHFPDSKTAVAHLRSRTDYQEPVYDWKVQGMEATETNEEVYPVQFREGGN